MRLGFVSESFSPFNTPRRTPRGARPARGRHCRHAAPAEALERRTLLSVGTGVFELDRNALDAAAVAGDDWNTVLLGGGGASEVNTGVLADAAGTTIFTGGGSKDDLNINNWRHTGGSVPDKDEITNGYAAAYIHDGDLKIFFGADRFAQNGDAQIGFWFFQQEVGLNANGTFSGLHEDGDILVLSNFTNGGSVSTVQVFRWNGPGGGIAGSGAINGTLDLLATGADAVTGSAAATANAAGTVNSAATPSPWSYTPKAGAANVFPTGAFYEGGINVTALLGGDTPCISSFLVETRSSQSVDATLKDFVLGGFDLCEVEIDKSGDALSKVGDTANYTFTITNTGAVPIFLDTITDNVLGDLESFVPASGFTLSPDEVVTFNVPFVVPAGAPDPLTNTVTVVYRDEADLSGHAVSDSDTHTTNLFQPSITIDKSANDLLAAVGDPITYTFTITNTSSADSPALDITGVNDTLLGSLTALFPDTLAPGASATRTVTRAVQAGDPDPLPNTVTVVSNPLGFPNVISASDSELVNLFQPRIRIDKTGDALSKVGDPVNYTIVVTNTSSADSPNLVGTVSDPLLGISQGINLAPGQSTTINATRTVQPGDPDPLVNTATVTATPVGSVNSVNASDSHSVNLFQPSINIVKTANDHLAAVGDPIVYTFTITNTSSADSPALDLTSVSDTLVGNLLALFPDTLAPGASATATVTRVVQAGDPDPLPNTVTVHSNPLGFPNDIFDSDSESVNLFQPRITIDKTGDALSKVGDPVNYTIVVTNTSSADSPNLVGTVSDPLLGISQGINLAPGQSTTINASRTVQPGDPDPLVNTATVTATPVGSVYSVNASDSHTVNLFQPSIDIVKTANDQLAAVGDPVVYTVTITNTSSADSPALDLTSVVDTLAGNLLGNFPDTLAPGASASHSYTRVVQAGDPDPLSNTVTVHSNPLGFPNDITDSDDETVNLFQPRIRIDKTGDALSKVGDPVNYTIVVTNTSSADSPNLVGTVSDPLLGISQGINLAPGQSTTINATRTVQPGDPDPLVNTATVTATPVGSVNSVNASDGHTVNLFQPSIDLTKTANRATVGLGETVVYTFTVDNNGSSDSPALVNVVLTDDNGTPGNAADDFNPTFVGGDADGDGKLDLNEVWTYTASKVVNSLNPDPLVNTARVTSNPEGFPNVISDVATASVDVLPPQGSVLPTGVDCDQFVDAVFNNTNTIPNLIGDLDNGFNLTLAGGVISNVSDPGAAFYFTTFKADTDANSTPSAVRIVQTSTGGSAYLMDLTQVSVYRLLGTAPNVICQTVFSNLSFTTQSDGIQFLIPDVLEGVQLVCRIRIDPKSVVGEAAPATDLINGFETRVNGVFADKDPDGVLLNIPPYALSLLAPSPSLFSTTRVAEDDLADLLA